MTYFYDATITVYKPQKISTGSGELLILPNSVHDGQYKAMIATKTSFEEASAFGKLLDGGATYSFVEFHLRSDVDIPVGSVFVYNVTGSLDNGTWYSVISRERRFNWFFKTANIIAKRIAPPRLTQDDGAFSDGPFGVE